MPAADLSSFKVAAAEVSSATKFNNLVQAIQDEFGDVDPDQIPGYPADVTKFLRGDGTWGTPPTTVYDRATGTVDVASTNAETSVFSKIIGANDLSTNKSLRLSMFGDLLHNNAAGDTLTIRLKFGGTTLFQDAADFLSTTGANRQPWWLGLDLQNLGATNSQGFALRFHWPTPATAAPTTGIGDLLGNSIGHGVGGVATLATIDTTTNQTLDITVQWSASSANNSFRKRGALLELI